MGSDQHFVYVVSCVDGTLYTGYATNVERRVAEHNSSPKGARYTKARRPVELVASARFESKHEAMRAEALFKRLSRPQKDELLARAKDVAFEEVLREAFGELSS